MLDLRLTLRYFTWHYTLSIAQIFVIFGNLFWFLVDFFSISIIFKTLFSPWKRMGETYKEGFNPEANLAALIVNLIMRITGFIFRIIILVVALISILLFVLVSLAVLILWLLWPFILLSLLITGFMLLFKIR